MPGSALAELEPWATELLASAPVAHLGLLDGEGRPRVLPVTFAMAEGAAWTAVDRKPKRVEGAQLARVGWLRQRPAAALTVDHYESDWSRLAWVQLLGEVTVLDHTAGEPRALAALAGKYDGYRERAPGGPLLRLGIDRVVCWRAGAG